MKLDLYLLAVLLGALGNCFVTWHRTSTPPGETQTKAVGVTELQCYTLVEFTRKPGTRVWQRS